MAEKKTLITVKRFLQKHDAVISEIYVDHHFVCYGLEDAKRDTKIHGETCIPAGRYKIDLRNEGGFHSRHKNQAGYKGGYMGMLWVRNVLNFLYILIHKGNWRKNTKGCLLVGVSYTERFVPESGRVEMWLVASRPAYHKLYDMVKHAAAKGLLEIEYIDGDEVVSV